MIKERKEETGSKKHMHEQANDEDWNCSFLAKANDLCSKSCLILKSFPIVYRFLITMKVILWRCFAYQDIMRMM